MPTPKCWAHEKGTDECPTDLTELDYDLFQNPKHGEQLSEPYNSVQDNITTVNMEQG